jgi:CheY-like chemotaxis protein
MFDPYFTTKPKEEGSGMGMAVVHGIVSRYGGGIQVDSEEGRGTTVNVYLPRRATPPPETEEAIMPPPAGGEAVLLVDDEPQLVAIQVEMLTRLGYRVTASESSVEALDIFRRQPAAFDIVITDMSMPQMNGVEFSQAVLEIRSDIPIILCTGYAADLTRANAHSIGVHDILMKPMNMQALAKSVRQAIDNDQIPSR